MPMTKLERAYLAGIVDGEGSICLVRSHARSSHRHVYPTLRVCNTSEELLEWIQMRCGIGTVSMQKNEYGRIYHWQAASNDAIKILAQIKKYLIIKQDQAELALVLWAENKAYKHKFGKNGKYFGNGWPIPRDLVSFRNLAFNLMQGLNRREVKLDAT